MKKIKAFTFIFSISLLISSCIVYHPMMADIPLISKKNELRIDGGVSLVPAANATVSYGLTKAIAIQGFGDISDKNNYYVQAAAGYFRQISQHQVIEFYSGYGYGHGLADTDATSGRLFGHYQLYFGQANFGRIADEKSNLEIGLGFKAGFLKSVFTDQNFYKWTSENGPFITYHDKSLLLEPQGFIRFGGKKIRFNLKIGRTFIHKYTHKDKALPLIPVNVGVGVNYKL